MKLFFAALVLAFFLFSCVSNAPEPEKSIELGTPSPQIPELDLADSLWIRKFTEIAPDRPRNLPPYEGFYLHKDGRLFLINRYTGYGKNWELKGNQLNLFMADGRQEAHLVYPQGEEVWLESVDNREDRKLYEKGEAWLDLEENHWIPVWLKEGQKVSLASSRKVYLLVLPIPGGMGVTGYGGRRHFTAGIDYDRETWSMDPLVVSGHSNEGSSEQLYENLYFKYVREADYFLQVQNELYLYSGTSPVITFRMMLFD